MGIRPDVWQFGALALVLVAHTDFKDHVLREPTANIRDCVLVMSSPWIWIEDEEEFLASLRRPINVKPLFVLVWHLTSHIVNSPVGVWLISHDEVNENNRLLDQFVVLEPEFVEEPLLPHDKPGCQFFLHLLGFQIGFKIRLNTFQGSLLPMAELKDCLVGKSVLWGLNVHDVLGQLLVLLVVVA